MVEVRVPASTANMGTGFDSFGAALGLYNRISVKEIDSGLIIKNFGMENQVASGQNNLIYRAIMKVFDYVGYERRGLSIYQKSDIPKTRGLGSSSACIVGGMVAANHISGKKLSYKKILELATEMEGHPDNVAPALFGGFCISAKTESGVYVKSIKLESNIRYIAMIPEYFVQTRKSRELLPENISLPDASHNIARAAAFAVAMQAGETDTLRELVNDKLHQPYRAIYIDRMYDIFNYGYSLGAKAMYLSGSGPTVIAMIDGENDGFIEGMTGFFEKYSMKYKFKDLSIDNVGTVLKYYET